MTVSVFRKQILLWSDIKATLTRSHISSFNEQEFHELEIVRQTIIAVEKMKMNGDYIADDELSV